MSNEGVTIDIGKTPKRTDEGEVIKENENKYYYNDNEHANKRVNITLTENPSEAPGYKQLEHRPGDNAKIVRIDNLGGTKGEFEKHLKDCTSVTVYYWSGDDYANPLVVKLTGQEELYYTENGSDSEWKDTDIKSNGLLKTLDGRNCLVNHAHIVDISHKGDDSYNCPACSQPVATSISSPGNSYTKITHSPSGIVGRLKGGQDNIKDIPIAENLSIVYVYWYPNDGDNSKPLLICLSYPSTDEEKEVERSRSSNYIWYKSYPPNGSKWTKVEESKSNDHTDCKNILKLLKEISGGAEVESGTGDCKEMEFEGDEEDWDDSFSSSSSLSTTSPHRLSPGAITGISIASVGAVGSVLGYGGWKLFLFLKNPV